MLGLPRDVLTKNVELCAALDGVKQGHGAGQFLRFHDLDGQSMGSLPQTAICSYVIGLSSMVRPPEA